MANLICHRGASKYAPQNTIPAFLKAVELNADGVEFDVHITKDKELVVCHNYTIEETSNGEGNIKNFTLDELKQFDFGIKYSQNFKNTRIPTLKEVLEVVKDLKIINVELKSEGEEKEDFAKRTIAQVKECCNLEKVIFSSFDLELVKITKNLHNSLKVGALFNTSRFLTQRRLAKNINFVKENGLQAIHPHAKNIKKKYVDICHKNDILVNTWGANSYESIKHMLDIGCDSVITDEIDIAMQICGRYCG